MVNDSFHLTWLKLFRFCTLKQKGTYLLCNLCESHWNIQRWLSCCLFSRVNMSNSLTFCYKIWSQDSSPLPLPFSEYALDTVLGCVCVSNPTRVQCHHYFSQSGVVILLLSGQPWKVGFWFLEAIFRGFYSASIVSLIKCKNLSSITVETGTRWVQLSCKCYDHLL